jgi:hypothetical protein
MNDWSHFTTNLPKLGKTLEAEMMLHFWQRGRETAFDMIERLKQVITCSYQMEQEETRAKYERNGYQVYRLKDADVVTKPGVCGYCGTKTNDHAEGCPMFNGAHVSSVLASHLCKRCGYCNGESDDHGADCPLGVGT